MNTDVFNELTQLTADFIYVCVQGESFLDYAYDYFNDVWYTLTTAYIPPSEFEENKIFWEIENFRSVEDILKMVTKAFAISEHYQGIITKAYVRVTVRMQNEGFFNE